jgi:hypothetical protein
MSGLLGAPHTMNQASYNVTRLARNWLITRRPASQPLHPHPECVKFAVFYTKVHDRILCPLMASDQPQAPPPIHQALRIIATEARRRLDAARLPAAA